MARTPLITSALAGLILLAGGCSSNSLKDENALLLEENQMLRAQLEERTAALETTDMELRDRQAQIAQLRRDLQSAQTQPATTGFEGIAGVSGKFGAGEVIATVENDILFASGKSTLRNDSRASLDAVARVLQSTYGGREIRVAGHTDTDPIRKSPYKSNYHLGFERSYAVRDYLVSKGIEADRIYVASHGPDRPAPTKAQSRRVEIVVVLN